MNGAIRGILQECLGDMEMFDSLQVAELCLLAAERIRLANLVSEDTREIHDAIAERVTGFVTYDARLRELVETYLRGRGSRDLLNDLDKPEANQVNTALANAGFDTLGKKPSLELVQSFLASLQLEIPGLSPVEIQIVREKCIETFKSAGIAAPARLVDAALTAVRGLEGDVASQVKKLDLSDPEPWPEDVDGAELLDELVEILERFVVLVEGAAEACALWVVHTYLLKSAVVTPRLGIVSPTKRCGKSTLLALLQSLVRRPLPASNITASATFRTIEKYEPTLLIDEADTFLAKNDELRGVLNSGHSRPTAFVIRTVGDKHEPRVFSTWAPVVIALIGQLPSTLADRSIKISMRRKTTVDTVERLRADRADDFLDIRQRVARFAAEPAGLVGSADPEIPAGLDDRAADNWRNLFAIADVAGGRWPQRARDVAVLLSKDRAADDESRGEQLLADLKRVFGAKRSDRLATQEILAELHAIEDSPWPEYRNGKPLTARGLASLLRPFGIKPRTVRLDDSTPKGYRLEDFREAFLRYLPHASATSATLLPGRDLGEPPSATEKVDVADWVLPKSPQDNDVAGVAATEGGPGEIPPEDEPDGLEFEEGSI